MNVSVNDDVQLKKAENAWKPGMKRESAIEEPETQKTQVSTSSFSGMVENGFQTQACMYTTH